MFTPIMKVNRKIAIVVNHVKMDDEDMLDVAFWLTKTPTERLAEVFRLRKNYYAGMGGQFPEKIEKVVNKRKL